MTVNSKKIKLSGSVNTIILPIKNSDSFLFFFFSIFYLKKKMSSQSKKQEKEPRFVEYDGFRLYAGVCKKCPSSVDPWIFQFCNLPQNKWYVPIDVSWVTDWFNQYGIRELFENFDEAIELISDNHSENWATFSDEKICQIHIQATRIYGLLHARWITQPKGLFAMKKSMK